MSYTNTRIIILILIAQLCCLSLIYSSNSGELTVGSFNLKWTDEQNEIDFVLSSDMDTSKDFYLAIGFSYDQNMVKLSIYLYEK